MVRYAMGIVVLLTLWCHPAVVQAAGCSLRDPGFGVYKRWDRSLPRGGVLIPERGGLSRRGGFDLIVHFHGAEAARKQLVPVGLGIVLVGIDVGTGSRAYADAYRDPKVFERLLKDVTERVAKKRGRKVYIRRLGLSSWSAGYGAVAQVLRQPIGQHVDAVILMDSLYAGYEEGTESTIRGKSLEPFVRYAALAARGRRFLYQSHSQIRTPGYASTKEVSHWLVKQLRGRLAKRRMGGGRAMQLFEQFDRRGYHVRGFEGGTKSDHCDHLQVLRFVVKNYLWKRWQHVPMARVPKSSPMAGRRPRRR